MSDKYISLEPAEQELNRNRDESTQVASQGSISIDAANPSISIDNQSKKDSNSTRRMRRTTFQARLGRKLDKIHRAVLDNNIRLSSNPTDMLRIKAERDERTRDLVSRTITGCEVLPIILPPMKDIPLRHLTGIRSGTEVTIPSLYTIDQQEYFEIYAPLEVKLEPDDLLVRIIYDDLNSPDDPYVMILQVSEQFATIGYSSIRYHKYWATFYNENLPQKIIDIFKEAHRKRALLNW